MGRVASTTTTESHTSPLLSRCELPRSEATLDGVVFVHVGKTGGGAIAVDLKVRNHSTGFCGRCGTRQPAGPWLSAAAQGCQVHLRPVLPHEVALRRWFIAVRDPLERAISAFNFRHPSRGEPGVWRRSPSELALYRCFGHVNAFANALPDSSAASALADDSTHYCGGLARRALVTSLGPLSQLDKVNIAWP